MAKFFILSCSALQCSKFKCHIHHIERFYAIGYRVDLLNLQHNRAMGSQDRHLNEIRDMEFLSNSRNEIYPLGSFPPFRRAVFN